MALQPRVGPWPSLTGFVTVILRGGLSAPRSTWFSSFWFNHQRHLVVKPPQTYSSEASETRVRNMAAEFFLCLCTFAPFHVGFFYMPWIYDQRLYFPSEGRRATDFITLKIYLHRPGLNPRTWLRNLGFYKRQESSSREIVLFPRLTLLHVVVYSNVAAPEICH
jgi:hypothetical protein